MSLTQSLEICTGNQSASSHMIYWLLCTGFCRLATAKAKSDEVRAYIHRCNSKFPPKLHTCMCDFSHFCCRKISAKCSNCHEYVWWPIFWVLCCHWYPSSHAIHIWHYWPVSWLIFWTLCLQIWLQRLLHGRVQVSLSEVCQRVWFPELPFLYLH